MTPSGPPTGGTPAAEHPIDAALVSALLAEQHPDLARLPLLEVDAGWDNALFRLGRELAVRLPRRAAAAPLVLHEQTWLPRLTPRLTLPTPAPLRTGAPGRAYPWAWSVVPWLEGEPADLHPPAESQAAQLARFLRALHGPAPADAPPNPFRGVPLATRAPSVQERLERLEHATDLVAPAVRAAWQDALDTPIDTVPTWLHGDLHPRNVLVAGGAITGVIDWGDITSGDPATDLASVWMLFDDQRARVAALAAYDGLSDATVRRARGWAVLFGAMLLDTGRVDNPRNAAIGARTLRRVAEPL